MGMFNALLRGECSASCVNHDPQFDIPIFGVVFISSYAAALSNLRDPVSAKNKRVLPSSFCVLAFFSPSCRRCQLKT